MHGIRVIHALDSDTFATSAAVFVLQVLLHFIRPFVRPSVRPVATYAYCCMYNGVAVYSGFHRAARYSMYCRRYTVYGIRVIHAIPSDISVTSVEVTVSYCCT